MASAYGRQPALTLTRPELSFLLSALPKQFVLSDGTEVTVDRFRASDVESMHQMMNDEIEAGDSYPHERAMDRSAFEDYYLSGETFVGRLTATGEVIGSFYIKPNFPGRCSHVANGGFLVNKTHRGKGVGGLLGACFLPLARDLGYRTSLFNLVFVTNTPSVALWKHLGFVVSGTVHKAGRLSGHEGLVDAVQFAYDLDTVSGETLAEKLTPLKIQFA